jgi:pSer/pThr/pTyr-binding forkhead associated (FHA) protein
VPELPEISKFLIVLAGPAAGEMIPIVDELRLGRAEGDCGDLAGDPLLSRHHAVVREAPDGPTTIEDLGSANGTFVNGERIHGCHPVRVGDTIKVGNSTLRLSEDVGETTAHSQEPKPRELAGDERTTGGELEDTGSIEQIEGE